jgi:hypothetical protein
MGLFGRTRQVQVQTETWQPQPGMGQIAKSYDMDDDRTEGGSAYGVTFALDGSPGAQITVWTYITRAPSHWPGKYTVGYRWDHIYRGQSVQTFYGADEQPYRRWSDCDEAARAAARQLAETVRTVPADDDLPFFEWDGRPF